MQAAKQSSITPITPSSARVSFLSPCVDRSFPLTEQISSYTSSPTSPFSEPFPDPLNTAPEDERPLSRPHSSTKPSLSSSSYLLTQPSSSALLTNGSYDPVTHHHQGSYDQVPRHHHHGSYDQVSHHQVLSSHKPYSDSTHCSTAFEKSYFVNDKIPKYSSMSFHHDDNHQSSNTPRQTLSRPGSRTRGVKDDETLNLLKKYYLEALVSKNSDSRAPRGVSTSDSTHPTSSAQQISDIVDYKQVKRSHQLCEDYLLFENILVI